MAKKSISKVKESDLLFIVNPRCVRWAVAGKCGCGYKLTPLNRTGSAVSFAAWSVVDYLKKTGYNSLADKVIMFSHLYQSRCWSRSTFYSALYELLYLYS